MEMQEKYISIGALKWSNLLILAFHGSCANRVMPPQPMFNTCNGFYCNNFSPSNPNSQKCLVKIGWDGSRNGVKKTLTTVEDVPFSVARFFRSIYFNEDAKKMLLKLSKVISIHTTFKKNEVS